MAAPKRNADLESDAPDSAPPPAKVDDPEILIENRAEGIRSGTHSRPREGQAQGAIQEHEITQVFLYPGFNFVPLAQWQLVRSGMADRIARSEIVEWPHGIDQARESVVLAALRNTGEERTLQRLLEHTKSDTIAAAIEKQQAEARRGIPAARRARSAHAQA